LIVLGHGFHALKILFFTLQHMTSGSMDIWVIHFSYVFFQVLYVINVHVGTYICVTKLIALLRLKTVKLIDVRLVFSAL